MARVTRAEREMEQLLQLAGLRDDLRKVAAERDQLRAENERLRGELDAMKEDGFFGRMAGKLATEKQAAERERDEAMAREAELRGALEDVLFECDGHADVDDSDDGIANIPNMAMRCEMIIDAALTAPPSAALARLKSGVLREAAKRCLNMPHDSVSFRMHEYREEYAEWLCGEADRLESTDAK